MSVSYYWLAEACKYQNPSYVFLDVGSLLYTQDAYNANQITKALLYMLPSLNKLQAILNCRAEGQSVSELLVPLIQFHTRWNELNQSDWEKGTNQYYLNGAYINFNSVLDTGKSELNPNGTIQYQLENSELNTNTEALEISSENRKYFELIFNLCREIEITLIPTKFPTMAWDFRKSEIINDFLNDYNLSLFDLHQEANIGLRWERDTGDSGNHTNYFGMAKTSHYISDYLKELTGTQTAEPDETWENTLEKYAAWEQEQLNEDWQKAVHYLSSLAQNKEDWYIICSVRDEACGGWNAYLQACIEALGLKGDFYSNLQNSYIAVIDQGNVIFEEWADSPLELQTAISNQYVSDIPVYIKSGGYTYGNCSYIRINNIDYSLNQRGLNFVVVNAGDGKVISSAAIDTHTPETIFNQMPLDSEAERYWNIQTESSTVLENGRYMIAFAADPQYVLEAKADGSITLEKANGEDSQKFDFESLRNGFYSISANSGKKLDVKNWGSTEGTYVSLNGPSQLASQKWFIAKNPNGSYGLMSLYNGLSLDVPDGVAIDGNIIRVWENNYSPAQQFILQKND